MVGSPGPVEKLLTGEAEGEARAGKGDSSGDDVGDSGGSGDKLLVMVVVA